jgi:hypothetical protein
LNERVDVIRKRVVAIATIFFLIVFEFSCMMYSLNKESPEKAAFHQGPRNEVWAVMKKSKEYIEFSAGQRGRIVGDHIVGLARLKIKKEIEIPRTQVLRIEKTGENIEEAFTTDGKRYRLLRVVESENKFIGEMDTNVYQETSVSIALSDIEMVWFRAIDPLRTFLVNLGLLGAAAGIVFGGLFIIFAASGGFD